MKRERRANILWGVVAWLVTKPVRNTGAVCDTTPVSTRANSISFQLKMKQISAVAAMPGDVSGMMTRRKMVARPAPSIAAASSVSTGTSARNDRIIHTAIGRFIEVYRITISQMLSSIPIFCAMR